MSISTDITGNMSGTNQLFDLLSLVSNATQYEAKLKTLQSATDEYKKHLALVGPADEILQIREGITKSRKELDEFVERKQKEAEEALTSAKQQAEQILEQAKQEAEKARQSAQVLTKEANTNLVNAKATKKQADDALKVAEARAKQVDDEKKAVEATKAAAETALSEYQKLKDDLIAKHKAFIEGL